MTFVFLLTSALPVWSQDNDQPCGRKLIDNPFLTVVALYSHDVEALYLAGICQALDSYELGAQINLKTVAYGNEAAAFEHLKSILQNEEKTADIILGPTDSGVFLRAHKEIKNIQSIPVVSPLVTAPIPFDPDRKFYTANVTLTRRAKHLAYALSKYALRSITVLHSNSPFGQQTEAAFREAYLGVSPTVTYRPVQYETRNFGEKGPYRQIHQVLMDRPEGLGIFGTREEISTISKLLSTMNVTSIPYRPMIFTPIDFRQHNTGSHGITFISLKGVNADDDVVTLTKGIASLLLKQLDPTQSFKYQRDVFLNKLADLFHGASSTPTTRNVMMTFRDGRNLSDVHILQRHPDQSLSELEAPKLLDLFIMKFALLYHTRGWWVIASLFLIIFIPIVLSILDLKGWYRGNVRELLINKYSLSFIAFNSGIVVLLYLYLAETGRVLYDSPLTALVVAVGPMTFLKSTIFNTATGKAIGLSGFYDSSLKWLNSKLRTKKFQLKQKFISILAYYNSLDSMKYELNQSFSHARTQKEKGKLSAELQEELDEAHSHLQKRVVCARRLFEEYKWQQLIEKEFVPPGFRSNHPLDPDEMIKASARYVKENRDKKPMLDKLHERAKAVLDAYGKEEIGINEEKWQRPYHAVRTLVQYGDYGSVWLKEADLLPKDWGNDRNLGMWESLRAKFQVWAASEKSLPEQDTQEA